MIKITAKIQQGSLCPICLKFGLNLNVNDGMIIQFQFNIQNTILVLYVLARIFKAANIKTSVRIEGRKNKTPEATFHSLRHTFVSFSANAGVPLHVIQAIVGHESTTMTRHYYHENLTALQQAVNAIPTLG